MKILSFGEILWDIYPDKKFIGGAPFNFAAHMAKQGADVYMLSALGNDPLGKESLDCVQHFGIKTRFISVSNDKATGRCLVSLDETGIPHYDLLEDVAYDFIPCPKAVGTFDILYFGSLALRSSNNLAAVKELIGQGRFPGIFVDINIRPPYYSEETLRFCVQNATILKISSEELPFVEKLLALGQTASYAASAKALAEKYENLKLIVITLGAEGAYAFDCLGKKEFSCPGQKVKPASTVGAGDSFSAAFLYHYSSGRDIQFCLDYASKIAAFVVSCYEAVPDYKAEDYL